MKKVMGYFIFFFVMAILSGCNQKADNNSDRNPYKIYYVDTKRPKLVSENYYPVKETKEELVEELLGALRTDPNNIVYKKALPDNVTIKDFSFIEDDSISINFDSAYLDIKTVNEVLCRATIVKTLTQIKGLEYVLFSVNGVQLTDINGNSVGLMAADDFIESTGGETNYKVTLYFSNETGDKLRESNVNIYYTGTGTIEEVVIKQLISGPVEVGMYDTVPDGTTLLNVVTREGICYVDFNEKFLDKLPNVTDEVIIYSVVNSLVELPNINKVQFYINGEVRPTYRDNIPFDLIFERNLNIVE